MLKAILRGSKTEGDIMTTVIDNSTFAWLPSLGEQLGGFLTAILPAIIQIIVILGIIGGVVAIIYAIVTLIRKSVSKGGKRA